MRQNHKTLAVVTSLVGVCMGGAALSHAADPQPQSSAESDGTPVVVHPTDCRHCHSCQSPTPETPCLHPCSRHRTADIAESLAKSHLPEDVILLNMLSDKDDAHDHFGPVPFDHEGHAKWAELGEGCVMCHHFTPEGELHPTCQVCHELAYKRQDIRKPGLKGAYHRQCMGCHREWSHDTKCSACHLPRIGEEGVAGQSPEDVTSDDLIGKMHPPIPAPVVELYLTITNPEDPEEKTNVHFHHERHTDAYGFSCAECHKGDSCAQCHDPELADLQRRMPEAERHSTCSTCHDTVDKERCDACHIDRSAPQPAAFDHANTGWPLKSYHGKKGCRACHKDVPFTKLDRTCTTCHSDWEPDSFDHAITGQILDENHEEIDCADCHKDSQFDRPPKCDECHEEDEGFIFPGKRPGPVKKP